MKQLINNTKKHKVKILYFDKYKLNELESELVNSWVEIDLKKLANNIHYLKNLLPDSTKMMAVVKADAYGHGSLEISLQALKEKVSYLGVATVAEGKILRQSGIEAPILVLGAIFPEQISIALKNDLEITLTSEENIISVNKIADSLGIKAQTHLKIDSGMGRVGIRPEKLPKALDLLKNSLNIKVKGIFTHFAESENSDFTFTKQQLGVFSQSLELIKSSGFKNFIIHSANSSATLIHPESYFDMVRTGLSMYGIGDPETPKLEPVLSLKSKIINIKDVPSGNSLGYGRSFTTNRNSIIGLIPIGYADGLPRILSNRQDVLINGKRCPIVGNISMDQCMVDLTDLKNVSMGESVVLIGNSGNEVITINEWAQKSYSIPYEILCGFGNRLPRIYLQ